MKKNQIRCHCGALAVLRHTSYVHGDNAQDGHLYVCARYPQCDSYVGTHRKNRRPMGTLASKPLRDKRIEAHRVFNQMWKSGLMQKWQAYLWMQSKFGMNEKQAHVAKFSEYMCEQLISECTQALRNNHLVS